MKILVIGSGGREHAIVWKIRQNQQVKKIYCAPGNAGISEIAECVNIKAEDVSGLLKFAQEKKIDLTVVGPEGPLVEGIVDMFEKNNLKIFGPSQAAAKLEGSKIFSKEFLKKYYIPTADFKIFDSKIESIKYAKEQKFPLVIKADGLAAGKGVFICKTINEVEQALIDIFDKKIFGDQKVLIEEFLQGQEASILVFCDGTHGILMESSQDHKRIFDGDEGPNTGGMGTYSPAPLITKELTRNIYEEIIIPTLYGMKKEGMPYKGVLYAGLMITEKGPMVLEFNARFGDPETQVILPRLKIDLVDVMQACIEERLNEIELEWKKEACVCVVLASAGYPGEYEKGKEIKISSSLKNKKNVYVFHAGTALKGKDLLVTSGGRVLGVSALGENIKSAIENAYSAVKEISFEGMFYRKDIGKRAIRQNNGAME